MKRLSLVAGAVLALIMAVPVMANSLHQQPPIVGTQFGSSDCSEGLGQGWVFVNTGSHDATGAVLDVLFLNANNGLPITVAGFTPGNGVVHYFVGVSVSDTLLAAEDNLNTDGLLNLSHVCYGPQPSDQPTPTPSDSAIPTPSDSATPTPSDSATPTPSLTPVPTKTPTPSASATPSQPPLPPTDTSNDSGNTTLPLLLLAGVFVGIAVVSITKRLRE